MQVAAAAGGLEGKLEGYKKRTVLAPHPCPQKVLFSWKLGYHVRRSELSVDSMPAHCPNQVNVAASCLS